MYLMRVNHINIRNLCYNPDFQLRDILNWYPLPISED